VATSSYVTWTKLSIDERWKAVSGRGVRDGNRAQSGQVRVDLTLREIAVNVVLSRVLQIHLQRHPDMHM